MRMFKNHITTMAINRISANIAFLHLVPVVKERATLKKAKVDKVSRCAAPFISRDFVKGDLVLAGTAKKLKT